MAKDLFWENSQQASERLNGCCVLYEDKPVFIRGVRVTRDDLAIADLTVYPSGEQMSHNLADERFHKFRKLPPLGWTNLSEGGKALYLRRRIRRSTRHGLCSDNLILSAAEPCSPLEDISFPFNRVISSQGFADSCKAKYPTLGETLETIKEGSFVALSKDFALCKSKEGLYGLYFKDRFCGTLSDAASLTLFKKYSYLREILQESRELSLEKITEF